MEAYEVQIKGRPPVTIVGAQSAAHAVRRFATTQMGIPHNAKVQVISGGRVVAVHRLKEYRRPRIR